MADHGLRPDRLFLLFPADAITILPLRWGSAACSHRPKVALRETEVAASAESGCQPVPTGLHSGRSYVPVRRTTVHGDAMLKTTRRAASAAVLILAAVAAVIPLATQAQGQTPAPAAPGTATKPATPPAPAATPPTPAPISTSPATPAGAKAAIERASTAEVENPYGLEALWKGGDWVAKATLVILVHHVDGQLVHHHHQALRAVQAAAARRTRRANDVLEGAVGAAGRGDAEDRAARSASSPNPGSRRRRSTTACSATST